MKRRFVYRFRFLVFLWLARRWPRNPFLFFFDLVTVILDAVLLGLISDESRFLITSSYAHRLDCARQEGVLPPPPPRAAMALRQALGLEP